MIRASHPSKNRPYTTITCSDGNVFHEGCLEDCYDEAMAYERKILKRFLSQHVNVVYDIMQDPEKNEDGEYETLADLLNAPENVQSRFPIYVLKPKPTADLEYVAKAVKSWYQYLIIRLQANWMMLDIPDLDIMDFTKYECIETKFDHPLRFNNAYVIVAKCFPSSPTIWLTLTTIQDEVYNYHRKIDILSKEQAEFIDLGERVVDIGIK